MHQSSGRVGQGYSLALLTAVVWGLLPIELKWLLNSMSAATITEAVEHTMPLTLTVNGKPRELDLDLRTTLLDALREIDGVVCLN